MGAFDILEALRAQGLSVNSDGVNLLVRPKGVSEEVRALLRDSNGELLRYLARLF